MVDVVGGSVRYVRRCLLLEAKGNRKWITLHTHTPTIAAVCPLRERREGEKEREEGEIRGTRGEGEETHTQDRDTELHTYIRYVRTLHKHENRN